MHSPMCAEQRAYLKGEVDRRKRASVLRGRQRGTLSRGVSSACFDAAKGDGVEALALAVDLVRAHGTDVLTD